jgi:hypothetical protein
MALSNVAAKENVEEEVEEEEEEEEEEEDEGDLSKYDLWGNEDEEDKSKEKNGKGDNKAGVYILVGKPFPAHCSSGNEIFSFV